MKFEIKKIVKPLYLRDYAEAYGDTHIMTWVNPPMSLREQYQINQQNVVDMAMQFYALVARVKEMPEQKDPQDKGYLDELQAEISTINGRLAELNDETVALLSRFWSESADPEEHMSEADIWELNKTSQDTDPQLFGWLKRRTAEMIVAHLGDVKKG